MGTTTLYVPTILLIFAAALIVRALFSAQRRQAKIRRLRDLHRRLLAQNDLALEKLNGAPGSFSVRAMRINLAQMKAELEELEK